ncbi:hypothetical protein EBU99_09565 [bacterium]|nr:hypothetical protein [bacterium]
MTKQSKIVLGAFVFLCAGCDSLARMKSSATEKVVDFIPRQVDQKLGQVGRMQAPLSTDSIPAEADKHLASLVEPLLLAAALPELKPQFRITQLSLPNAFAFPDGSIFFTSKLIEIAETPEEILSVAGHELAHVARRHSMQQIVSQAGVSVILNFFVGDLGTLADLLSSGSALLNLKFSRDHEREADALSVQYLAKAQLPTKGAAMFFERMKKFQEKTVGDAGNSSLFSFISTHPATDERLAWAKSLSEVPNARLSAQQKTAFNKLKATLSARTQEQK